MNNPTSQAISEIVGESRSFLVRFPGSQVNEQFSIAFTRETVTIARGQEALEIPRDVWNKLTARNL